MASGGINWHYVAPVVMIGFMLSVRWIGLPLLSGSLHEAGVREMERNVGSEWRQTAGVPKASSNERTTSAGPSMLGWALGLGSILLVGGGVVTYFVMDRGEDDGLDGARP